MGQNRADMEGIEAGGRRWRASVYRQGARASRIRNDPKRRTRAAMFSREQTGYNHAERDVLS